MVEKVQNSETLALNNAIQDIRNLMARNDNLSKMQHNILELTDIFSENEDSVLEDINAKNTKSQKFASHNNMQGDTNNANKSSIEPAYTTIEDLVRELLKPALSQWLNDNLPSIVKTIVENEIKTLIPNKDGRI